MSRQQDFEGRVAIVTGAGEGLGRSHALALAASGAKIVVNEIGMQEGGETLPSRSARSVAAEIEDRGGEAVADWADVADYGQVEALVARTIERWGRVDVLVNNAGILRDRSFSKMPLDEFRDVVEVHLMGTVNCTKAVWPHMKEQGYGRILLTTSASGLVGNFGQSNYGAAKAAMIGLMNVLHIEGGKDDIRINCLAPTANTAMTRGLLNSADAELLQPETVSPAVLYLTSEEAPSKLVMGAGAGVFSTFEIRESCGAFLPEGERTAEGIRRNMERVADMSNAVPLANAFDQTQKFVEVANDRTPSGAV